MRKISVLSAICVLSLTSLAFGQTHTQQISFDDGVGPGNAGIYDSDDSFGLDIFLTFSGYRSIGFSLWLATSADAASGIFLTNFSYGTTFIDPTQPFSGPLGFTLLQSDGTYTTPQPSDLGATANSPYDTNAVNPGTYFVGHLTISLKSLAPGTYVLQSDTTNPRASEVSSYDPINPPHVFEEFLPAATYTITVVPEPSTSALLVVMAIGLGACVWRRTVSKRSS